MIVKPKILVILGPTASGKTSLSIELAKSINKEIGGYNGAEIISADSRQVYKGLDLGTGKITSEEMFGIPHHLLDVVSAKEVFTVADYKKLGGEAIKEILSRGKLPIICGGTGLYIDALIYDYSLPPVAPDLKLRKLLERQTDETLFQKLQKLDPRRAEKIDCHNKRRLIRALEIVLKTGRPIPLLRKKSPYNVLKIGIMIPAEQLKKRIKQRLEERTHKGMVEEAEKLHRNGITWKRMEDLGLEYRYIVRYLRGLLSYDEMFEKLNQEIVRYAKRQMTWFKRDKKIHWISDKKTAAELVRNFLRRKEN